MLSDNCLSDLLDVHGYSPLHIVLQLNFLEIAFLLLDNGASVNTVDPDNYTTS